MEEPVYLRFGYAGRLRMYSKCPQLLDIDISEDPEGVTPVRKIKKLLESLDRKVVLVFGEQDFCVGCDLSFLCFNNTLEEPDRSAEDRDWQKRLGLREGRKLTIKELLALKEFKKIPYPRRRLID